MLHASIRVEPKYLKSKPVHSLRQTPHLDHASLLHETISKCVCIPLKPFFNNHKIFQRSKLKAIVRFQLIYGLLIHIRTLRGASNHLIDTDDSRIQRSTTWLSTAWGLTTVSFVHIFSSISWITKHLRTIIYFEIL